MTLAEPNAPTLVRVVIHGFAVVGRVEGYLTGGRLPVVAVRVGDWLVFRAMSECEIVEGGEG